MSKLLHRLTLFVFIYALAFTIFNLGSLAHAEQAENIAPATEPSSATAPATSPPVKPATIKRPVRRVIAVFDTSMGIFKARLFHTHAPKTVENFILLAEGKKEWKDPVSGELKVAPIYTNRPIHRVRKNFIIQAGDPYLDGRVDVGFHIADEFHPDLKYNKPGVLAMANQFPEKNTNSTQFFITLRELTGPNDLANKNPIFGEIIEGMEVVQAISDVPVNRMNERPLKDVLIKSIKIIREY